MFGVLTIAGAVDADAAGFDHMDGFSWGMMGIGWLVMLSIVGLIVWVIIQSTSGSSRRREDATASAQRILAERFARGDIDEDDYRQRAAELRR